MPPRSLSTGTLPTYAMKFSGGSVRRASAPPDSVRLAALSERDPGPALNESVMISAIIGSDPRAHRPRYHQRHSEQLHALTYPDHYPSRPASYPSRTPRPPSDPSRPNRGPSLVGPHPSPRR